MITQSGMYHGWLVHVHVAAPTVRFHLPDGALHVACEPGCWICESLGSEYVARKASGHTRMARFGVIDDCFLRPIRPGDTEDETPTEVISEITA